MPAMDETNALDLCFSHDSSVSTKIKNVFKRSRNSIPDRQDETEDSVVHLTVRTGWQKQTNKQKP